MRKLLSTAFILASGLALTPASAAPIGVNAQQLPASNVLQVRADCSWVNGGWFYRNGARFVVCRPDSPGRGYRWHREGNRFGWYNSSRREFHHRNW